MAIPATYTFTTVSGGVGTTVAMAHEGEFKRVIIPGTYVGTIAFHDSASVAGTSATSNIFTLGLPTTPIPQSLEVNVNCKNGLLYQATGTPVVTIVSE